MYLLSEVQKVYRSQGQNIHDKHFEIIISKMMSKAQITRPGDSALLPGDVEERLILRKVNEEMLSEGKQPAKFQDILLGITRASLSTESFLSAASFQHTIRVLAQAAIAAKEDNLYGLKENVIIGKLIPAGTGFGVEADGGGEDEAEAAEGEAVPEDGEAGAEVAGEVELEEAEAPAVSD